MEALFAHEVRGGQGCLAVGGGGALCCKCYDPVDLDASDDEDGPALCTSCAGYCHADCNQGDCQGCTCECASCTATGVDAPVAFQ